MQNEGRKKKKTGGSFEFIFLDTMIVIENYENPFKIFLTDFTFYLIIL
jgi:hypothetical protein